MKTEVRKLILVLITGTLFFAPGNAQKGSEDGSKYGHGEDSINCLRNYSIYREYFRQHDFADAYGAWKKVYTDCPASFETMYKNGIDMYNEFIQKEKDPQKQSLLIDTLQEIYMKRIKYFGKEGEMYGRFGLDYLMYKRDNIDDTQKGYDFLEKSINMEKDKALAAVVAAYFTSSIVLNKAGKLNDSQVAENYMKASDIIDANLKKTPNSERWNTVKKGIDDAFAMTPAASCKILISIYTPKFNANPNDLELVKKITKILDEKGCTDSLLFERAAVAQNNIEPSAASSYNLGILFRKKGDYAKAVEYFKKAIDQETDATLKANYYLILGSLYLTSLNQPEAARRNALEAIKLRANWGAPYILIGNAYIAARQSCGSDDFERSAIFWVAVDKFIQAKNVDPSMAEDANRLIEQYSKYFPNKETAFFKDVKPGDTYTVGCWINETTKARF